ncbi:prolyl oligopeptidase family-domain-containing protein [Blakeslea trispora]|nr:prolyl oligopeptidase family-domain-containing protein [Blakeslea trispora]
MGTDQSEDILIYEELDDTVFVDITCSKDNKFIQINANTLSSSEVRVVSTDHDFSTSSKPLIHLVEPRVPGVEYYVDHHHDNFYILTNADGATNFKLVKTSDHTLERKYWQDVITMKATEKIEDVDLFQHHIVVYGKKDGLPMMLCHDLTTCQAHTVKLPEKFCVLYPGTNLDFHTDQVRFSIQSPFMHESTFEYDMSTQKLTAVRVQPVKIELNGKNPVLMRSYGAYGTCTDIDFRVEQFPLLERGWVIALPHVSFKDFIAVAEHLVDSKLTSPDHLTAMGTSAGGLLVGAMLHMRPDLFRALLLKVPFVDPLSAMLNPALPLTQIEYPEWGNPTEDPEAYDLIQSYSPYENVPCLSQDDPLPSLYITGGMKDQRVAYWQPLKLMARLRHSMPDHHPSTALLHMDLDRGHFSGTEQESRLSDLAQQMAFLISQVTHTIK